MKLSLIDSQTELFLYKIHLRRDCVGVLGCFTISP